MVGCTFITIVFLGYTTFGKKVINTGLSTTGSHYAGYNVKFNQILAMVLSGAFAGILGIMVYCGRANGMPCNILSRSIPQDGFNGMSVGLIAMANPWAVVPISFFFGMIDGSKADIQGILSVDHSISDLMFGVVVYGAAIISFFYYVVPFR
jgi:simple sugar transport system permease protein